MSRDSTTRWQSWLVTANQIVSEGAILLRNVLLARLLGPEQMGMALMLAILLRCLEMISYLAADRLLVQARDGNTSRFQANAHGLEVMRGMLSGSLLGALATPAAFAFGHPEMAPAFVALGLVPLLRGFSHLDYRRMQRILDFGPTFRVESPANLVATLSVWPVWMLTRDYTALVWVSLVQAITHVALSHVLAVRPYRLRIEGPYLVRMLSFGWPMLLNSLLMFGVFQGDRLIVALSISAQELGSYALALQLGLLPTLVLARGSLSLLLPLLARQQDKAPAFAELYQRAMLILIALACLFFLGYALLGGQVVSLIFGTAYSLELPALALIGYALSIRIVRVGPSTAALALGDSRTLLQANLARLLGLLFSLWAGLTGLGLIFIVAGAAAGESMALLAGLSLVKHRHRVVHNWPVLLAVPACLVGLATAFMLVPHSPAIAAAAGTLVLVFAAISFHRGKADFRNSRARVIN